MDIKISLDLGKNKVFPLFLDEVLVFFIKRNNFIKFTNCKKMKLNVKKDQIYTKTLEYVIFFSKLEKKITKKLRKFINNNVNQNLEASFVACKIIDLMPLEIKEVKKLISNFIEKIDFKITKFLFEIIYHIIKD